ncbi:MAG: glycine-rich domain-containing protein [archaeon]|jgi:uncharacterized repeat protein (TIGR02543 family)
MLINKKKSFAQGTIEYLIIIAVVVVIALVVVSILTSFLENGTEIDERSSQISNMSNLLVINDSIAGEDGNGLIVLKNNDSETITINKIMVDGVDHNFSENIPFGSEKSFKVEDITVCDSTKKSYTIKIYYTSKNGLSKIADFSTQTIDCTPVVTPAGSFVEETNTTEEIITYSVTYIGNNNDDGEVPTDNNTYELGETVFVLDNINLEKNGFDFNGWNAQADGSGDTNYILDQNFTITADTNLYAQWSLTPTYTVTYQSNDANSGDVPTDSNNYESGETVFILDNIGPLIRSGFDFNGWNTFANGSGDVNYTADQNFTMGSADVNLYAQWIVDNTCVATGGDEIDTTSVPGYTIHKFTTVGSANFEVISGICDVNYLIVGGGGSAGDYSTSGGGGAGGFLSGTTTVSNGIYSIMVGAGGSAVGSSGNPGGNSTFLSHTAIGGGRGGSSSGATGSGGSGGGGNINFNSGGTGTAGQGYAGGNGTTTKPYPPGGGGGASHVGYNGVVYSSSSGKSGNGGNGIQSDITGTLTYYAGGGGGSPTNQGSAAGTGGLGGGGDGANPHGENGTDNTGGGGGGGINDVGLGGAGGSGIVIVRYLTD